MAEVLALQDLLVPQSPRRGTSRGIERLNRMMSGIKCVGCVEKIPLNGTEGTYFIIEGRSRWTGMRTSFPFPAEGR